MPKQLPIRLGNEPLVEAVCEIHVSPASGSLHTVLPGYLYAKFPGEVSSLEQLPALNLPDAVRQQEPALANAPLIRLTWGQYYILVGARQCALACKLPYPGWDSFKANILVLFNHLLESGLIRGIDRYSVKYVNFFASAERTGQTSMMDWLIRIGEFNLSSEAVQLRIEVPKDGFLTVISVVSPASIRRPNATEEMGGVVDIDTICAVNINDVNIFRVELSERLQRIRLANKQAFFDCLSDNAISALRPVYA